MKCNIDEKGRKVRMRGGISCCALGVLIGGAAWFWPGVFWWMIGLGIFLIATGVFQIFESRKSWCVLRAMGMKTPV